MLVGLIATGFGLGLDVSETTGLTLFTITFEWARILWIVAILSTFCASPFIAYQKPLPKGLGSVFSNHLGFWAEGSPIALAF